MLHADQRLWSGSQTYGLGMSLSCQVALLTQVTQDFLQYIYEQGGGREAEKREPPPYPGEQEEPYISAEDVVREWSFSISSDLVVSLLLCSSVFVADWGARESSIWASQRR